MRPNKLHEIWAKGGAAINGWLHIPHGFAAEVMAAQAWDSLTIDLQHGPIDFGQALTMLQAVSASEATPLARVPWNEPGIIMKLLDAGCYGIICPMVNTPDEARRFVGACRYPPDGYRSFGPTRVQLYAGGDYPLHANETVVTMAMIETRQAIDDLDAILDTPGLDAIYVGPSDLSQSLIGRPALDHREPPLSEVIEAIVVAARKRGIIAGIHTGSPDYARHIIERGYQFVTIQSDARLLADGIRRALELVRGEDGSPPVAGGAY